ncbi:MAG: MauM/NapG family ferredoxin-type protein [Candidatus Latescibacterota bacterium]|nr:MAG: MauM/NapG family ferredoxin-type protein [Candidatus Latescibacterota bacterium]
MKKGIAVVVVGGTAGGGITRLLSGTNATVVRPPGAGEENDFLAKCIRCAKCVQACPYDSIKTAGLGDGASMGTPFLELREIPCYMCEDLPCVGVCPTDALDPTLTDAAKMLLGTAVIVDREACLSLNGIRCEICYRVCPLIDKAIVIEKHAHQITGRHTVFEPVVQKEVCTGCGICENACPLDDTAIAVVPTQRGDKAAHYDYLRKQERVEL